MLRAHKPRARAIVKISTSRMTRGKGKRLPAANFKFSVRHRTDTADNADLESAPPQ
jgi:hypothetical protein